MKPLTVFLSILFIFLAITINGQDLFFRKGQLKLNIMGTDCQLEATNTTIRATLNRKTGDCNISIPVVAFQLKTREAKKKFIHNCFTAKDHPMITFEGKLIGIERLEALRDGTFPVELEGQWQINGESIDFSETLQLHVENRQVSLAFNSESSFQGMDIEMDCEINFGERMKAE